MLLLLVIHSNLFSENNAEEEIDSFSIFKSVKKWIVTAVIGWNILTIPRHSEDFNDESGSIVVGITIKININKFNYRLYQFLFIKPLKCKNITCKTHKGWKMMKN
jgi:hypothetical protein